MPENRERRGSVIERIRARYPTAVSPRCEESGCRLGLEGLSDFVVLRPEGLCGDQRMCDCLVFVAARPVVVGCVELKSKTTHHSEVQKKLLNGAKLAKQALADCGADGDPALYLVALCKRWKEIERGPLIKRQLDLQGRKHSVVTKRCGISFLEIIQKFG